MTTGETFPGRYVGLEGLDGAGKTTQLEYAREYSEKNKLPTVFVREPGGTPLGVEIRHMILMNRAHNLDAETEFLLFMADRNYLFKNTILPALEKGMLVISDRRIESSYAYQAAGGNMSRSKMKQIAELVLHPRYVVPDALAVLSISKEVRKARLAGRPGHSDKIEERHTSFFDRVYDEYVSFESLPYAQAIDAERTPDQVFKDLRPILFGPEHA